MSANRKVYAFFVSLLFSRAAVGKNKRNMKLIVLYGPENSGKTTTLKIVYGVIKKHNEEEQKRFLYVDRNQFNDYIDVLKVPSSIISTLSLDESVGCSHSCSNNIYGDDEDLDKIFDDKVESDSKESLGNEEKDVDIAMTTFNNDDIVALNTYVKIGIILEGDYGCKKISPHKSLFDRIKDFDDCDIIICACSILKSKTKSRPSNCIKKVIKTYHTKFAVIRTLKFAKKGYKYRLPLELGYAKSILHVLKHI